MEKEIRKVTVMAQEGGHNGGAGRLWLVRHRQTLVASSSLALMGSPLSWSDGRRCTMPSWCSKFAYCARPR